MQRVDIVVTGLDPTRPRAQVIEALAAHLSRSTDEIALLLEVAPAPLLRALSAADAERVLGELVALGVRVRTRAAADPSEASAREVEGTAPPPADASPPPVPAASSSSPPAPPASTPPAPPEPALVRDSKAWFEGDTSLAPPAPPSAPSSTAPSIDEAASAPAPVRATPSLEAREPVVSAPQAPRVFFPALLSALVSPFVRTHLGALAVAAALLGGAVALGALGLREELELGPLLLALAVTASSLGIGVVMQVVASALSARVLGAAQPAELPGRLMDDYLRPGGSVLVVVLGLALLTSEGWSQLVLMRATRLTLGLFTGVVATYGALGFVLSAASGTAFGFLELGRMLQLFDRRPLRGLTVVALGALSLGAAGLGLARVALAAALAPSSSAALFDALALGTPLAFVAGVGAASTGAALGQLFYANGATQRGV